MGQPHEAAFVNAPGADHFDVYNGPEHEVVVADQIGFLRGHLC